MHRRSAPAILTKSTQGYMCIAAWMAASIVSEDVAAQSIYLPLGLQPGDQYRIAFVTDGSRDALSSDIADYNAFVTAEAMAAGSIVQGLAVDWFAIASTADVDAIENTDTDPTPAGNTGVPIYLVDGQTRVVHHYDALWNTASEFLLSPINLTQYGVTAINRVWTGTTDIGLGGGIGGPLGNPGPTPGSSGGMNPRWINSGTLDPGSDNKSFYAISSVLIAVPEPSTGVLLVGMAALVFRRRR